MKTSQQLLSLLLLTGLQAPLLAADNAGGALVTKVQGKVTINGNSRTEPQLPPFYRLRQEDRLELAAGASLQLVMLQNGRQENWRGPLRLEMSSDASRCQPAPCQAEIRQLPPAVLTALTRTPNVLNDIRNRSGMVMVRGVGRSEQIQEMNDAYRQLRTQADKDDITPELYLLTRLYQLRQYKEIPKVLEDMKARQPDNPEVIAAQKQFNAQLQDMENRRKARSND